MTEEDILQIESIDSQWQVDWHVPQRQNQALIYFPYWKVIKYTPTEQF